MLEIKNLYYQIKNWKNIIENLNLKTKKWLFFIYWPSWSWKTTLLKLISWFKKPNKWHIKIKWTLWLFWQNYNLLNIDVQTNLKLPYYFIKKNIDNKRRYYLIEKLKIKHLLNEKIENLSEWEKERIWIIKTIIHRPNIALFDEAWNSLQDDLKKIFLNLILEYSQENIVFLISHDLFIKNFLNPKEKIYENNFTIYKI